MKILKYQTAHLKDCLSMFKTNTPTFFAKNEIFLFQRYLLEKDIHYYVLLEKSILIAAGGYGINKKQKTIDLTWGMVNSKYHKKGFGTKLLNYRIKRILTDFPKTDITLNTSQKTFKFYEKFDFKLKKITKNYYCDGLDRYDMKKSVS